MANQIDVQAALDAQTVIVSKVADDLTKLSADVASDIAKLQALITAGSTGVDLQPQVDAINATTAKLSAIAASLEALDTTVAPPAPTPAP